MSAPLLCWLLMSLFLQILDQTIKLLPKGAEIAKTIYERHTVLTEFFEQIGVKTSIAAEDACKIEHDISPESFKAIKKLVKKNNETKK